MEVRPPELPRSDLHSENRSHRVVNQGTAGLQPDVEQQAAIKKTPETHLAKRQTAIHTHPKPCVLSTKVSEQQLCALRCKLISHILQFLPVDKTCPGFPQVTGSIAEQFLLCSQTEVYTDLKTGLTSSTQWLAPEQLLHCTELTLAAANAVHASTLCTQLSKFLQSPEEKALGVTYQVILDEKAQIPRCVYSCQGEPVLSITIISPTHQPEVAPSTHALRTIAGGQATNTPVCISTTALLFELWERISRQDISPAELAWIGSQFNNIKAFTPSCAFIYAVVRQRYFELIPQQRSTVATIQPSHQEHLFDPHFRAALANIQKEREGFVERGHEQIQDIFESSTSSKPSRAQGARRKRMTPTDRKVQRCIRSRGKGLASILSAALDNDPKSIDREMQRFLTASTNLLDAAENRTNTLGQLFNWSIASELDEMIACEHQTAQLQHQFPHCPYLGKAQCQYAANPASQTKSSYMNQSSYPEFATKIENLVNEMLDHLTGMPLEEEQTAKAQAVIANLLFKYSQYMDKKNNLLPQLLRALSKEVIRLSQQYRSPEHLSPRNESWRILPHALIVLLGCVESPQLAQDVTEALAELLETSQLHGCYDLTAAVIHQLSIHKKILHLPPEHPSHKHIARQIKQFVETLHGPVGTNFDGSYEQVNTSRALLDLIKDIEQLPEEQRTVNGQRDWLKKTEKTAQHVYEHDRRVQNQLKNDIKKEAAAAAKAREQAKEKLRLARQQAYRAKTLTLPAETKQSCSLSDKDDDHTYTLTTEPLAKTAVVAEKLEPWEKQLKGCLKKYRNGAFREAKDGRNKVLKTAGSNINQAQVWTQCGEVLLEQHRTTLSALHYLSNTCHHIQGQLSATLLDIKQRYPSPPPRDIGQKLLPQSFPPANRLAGLVTSFPSHDAITSAASAIDEAITHYEQALDLLSQCTATEIQQLGCPMLDMMEADMKQLLDKQERIKQSRNNLNLAMKLRLDILKAAGLYGVPSRHAQQGPPQKSSLRSAHEVLETTAGEPSGLFPTTLRGEDRLTQLMDRIQQLRTHQNLPS